MREIEAERNRILRDSHDPAIEKVRQLDCLRGVGIESAWLLVMEFFAWREFTNRRQIGALAGLTPTPFQSGEVRRELGIAKSGNSNVRWLAIEIACPGFAISRRANSRSGSSSDSGPAVAVSVASASSLTFHQ